MEKNTGREDAWEDNELEGDLSSSFPVLSTASTLDAAGWNPMKVAADSGSRRAFPNFNLEDLGPSDVNGTSFQLRPESIPCPFQKESWKRCFKGADCQYKHGEYTPKILREHPKLAAVSLDQRRNVMLAMNLPKKALPADGFVSLVWITCTMDPSEFYVVPKDDWQCVCCTNNTTTLEIEGEACRLRGMGSRIPCGFQTFNELWSSMQVYYNMARASSMEYVAGELVAVNLNLNSERGWFRAVVLEDTVMVERAVSNGADGDDEVTEVSLKLLEFGSELRKSILDVRPLPRSFVYVDPMAYKCQLYGISSLLGAWGKKATQFFKNLLVDRPIWLQVKESVPTEADGVFKLFETTPLKVNLYFKDGKNWLNATEELCDRGLGIQWNPCPFRPAVNQILPFSQHEFIIKDNKTEQDQSRDSFLKVLERENSRLAKFVRCSEN